MSDSTKSIAVTARGRHPSYPVDMLASAHDVAAALRGRVPALGSTKLHKLLYYCQGHHLAAFGEALFIEPIAAWDTGPVVERLWQDEKYGLQPPSPQALDEAGLNTIGYVASRYGALTAHDLEVMTRGEPPWQLADAARRPHERVVIRPEWMLEYFRGDGAADDGADDLPLDSETVSATLRELAAEPSSDEREADSLEALRTWGRRGA